MRSISAGVCSWPSRLRSMSSSKVGSPFTRSSHLREERRATLARAGDAVEVGHRLTDVGEGRADAQVDAAVDTLLTCAMSGVYSREWSVDGGRGVAAVIGGDDEQVALDHRVEQLGHPRVDRLEPSCVALDVVAMTPHHVEVDEVGEDEAVVALVANARFSEVVESVHVVLGVRRLADAAPREDLADLADSVALDSNVEQLVEHGRLEGLYARSHDGGECA